MYLLHKQRIIRSNPVKNSFRLLDMKMLESFLINQNIL